MEEIEIETKVQKMLTCHKTGRVAFKSIYRPIQGELAMIYEVCEIVLNLF